jgi:hypothetical protein
VRLAAGGPSRRIAYEANLGYDLQTVKQNVRNAQQKSEILGFMKL